MRALNYTAALLLVGITAAGCATAGSAGGPIEVHRPDGNAVVREPSPQARRLFADALRSYDDGVALKVVDWDALSRKFQAVVDEDDHHAEAWFNLGVIAERRGEPREAVEHYRRAIRAKPSLRQAYENLAVLMEATGDLAGAEEQYKNVLRAYPNDAGARARLASLYQQAGDGMRAMELAQEALLRDPKNGTAHKVVARVHLDRGQLPLAKLVTVRARGHDDRDPELAFLLGEIAEKEGDQGAALGFFQQAVQLRGDFLPARARLGAAALAARHWEAAAQHYEVILRVRPDDGAALLDRAIALRGLGLVEEALEAYQKAAVAMPDDARPSYGIAVILHRHLDQPEEALAHYRAFLSGSAVNLSPDHPAFADLRECEQLVALRLEEKALAQRAAEAAAMESADTVDQEDDLLPAATSDGAQETPTSAMHDPEEPDDEF